MMTKQQLLDELRRLSPADRTKVMVMAQMIRAARNAGDTRPPSDLVAPVLAAKPRSEVWPETNHVISSCDQLLMHGPVAH